MEMIRQALAVTGVLVLMAAALWWLRRRGLAQYAGRARGPKNVAAVERLALGPQHALHLVRIAGRGLLVGTSPAGVTLLESFEWTRLHSDAEAR